VTKDEFILLQPGDVIRHKGKNSDVYIIHGNYGGRVTAVRTADVTNMEEWELRCKCEQQPVGPLFTPTAFKESDPSDRDKT
jgi:hypothetical protein